MCMNLMLGNYDENDHPNHVVAHGTCIEGGILPQIAMKTFFGSPSRPHYLSQKTITLDRAFNNTQQDEELLNQCMKVLVYVAKQTGRAIRITSARRNHMIYRLNWFRLVSSSYIVGELGLAMVEDQYYPRATEWFQRPPPTIYSVSLGQPTTNRTKLQQLVDLTARTDDASSDEWVFSVSELSQLDDKSVGRLAGKELGYDLDTGAWKRPFTCANILDERGSCLGICDGNANF
eukprot:Sro1341_g264420.2  (233) ;mRNA; f:3053-3751